MNNYLVFMYPDFEAAGGMYDCLGTADTLENGKLLVLRYLRNDFGEIDTRGLFLNRDAHIYSFADGMIVSKIFLGPYPEWGWKDIN